MNEQRLSTLWQRHIQRQCTPEEEQEFAQLLLKPSLRQHRRLLVDELFDQVPDTGDLMTKSQADHVFAEILETAAQQNRGKRKQAVVYAPRFWAAAAVIVIVVAAAWLLTGKNQERRSSRNQVVAVREIGPGKMGAMLTLANGKQVLLDTIKNGIVALQEGVTAKIVNGALRYEGVGKEIVYNTMTTPKGRQFQLTLPDGTNVWLNNTSSIRYPVVFTGAERHVEMTGEAYFEVTKNTRMPFRVTINNKAEIEVLGTSFNIKAYDNEADIATTLLDGAVQVAALNGTGTGKQAVLHPGQQAQINKEETNAGVHITDQVNIAKVMAWKNGLFNFDNTPLPEVMRQLERWYDIEIVYANTIPRTELVGKMTRSVTLNQLLQLLKELGVHCRLENRKLVVLP